MIVPVNPDIDEAQDVAEENRDHRLQGREICSLRRLQLQHHDRDDDGKHPITERFHAALSHLQVRYLSSLIGNRREIDATTGGRLVSTAPAPAGRQSMSALAVLQRSNRSSSLDDNQMLFW